MVITQEMARHFAEEWITAWNAHDLERILSHYTDDFEMSSPFVVKIAGEPSGTLKGKTAVREYWRRSFERVPELRFELIKVFWGAETVCIYYKSVFSLEAVEWFWMNENGKVKKAMADYDNVPG